MTSATPDPLHAPAAVALFASSQCAHCAEFKPAFRSAARSSQIPFFECDIESDPAAEALAKRMGVGSLPTVMFLRNGAPVWRIEGVVDAADVAERVRTVFADVIGAAAPTPTGWPT